MSDSRALKSYGKKKVKLPITAYILYLLVATVLITGVSLSKYATTVEESDSARVAYFGVDVSSAVLSAPMLTHPNDDHTEEISIVVSNADSNNRVSEVAVSHIIGVENIFGNIPLSFTLREGGNELIQLSESEIPDYLSTDGSVIFFRSSTPLYPGFSASTKSFTLSINWPSDENASKYSYELDAIRLWVLSEQVD